MIKTDSVSFCTPIVAHNLDELKDEISKAQDTTTVEFRRDYLTPDFNDELIIQELSKLGNDKDIIFTYRSPDEGGQSDVSNSTRFNTIRKYLNSNINYLDIEEKHLQDFLNNFSEGTGNIQLIVSHHNFDFTPERDLILTQLEKNSKRANIVKVAYKINSQADINNLAWASMKFRKEHPEIPLIIIGMGELGVPTRIFPEIVGSNLSFAPISTNISAPGQVSFNCLKNIRVSVNEKEKTRIFNWSNGMR